MAEILQSRADPTKVQMESAMDIELSDSNVTPMLTDLYQISMAHAYYVAGRQEETAVFDLFFRKCPFKGEICVFCGLDECLRFIYNYRFSPPEIEWLRKTYPTWTPSFFDYLAKIDCSELTVYAQEEGSLAFPRVPLLRIEGPLIVCQLLETTLLNLVNYPSLVATNALRHRIAAGKKVLLEFGLRRAQGPNGGLSASKYSYIGGFDGTSNVQAGMKFGLPVKGTHAHSYITSFINLTQVPVLETVNDVKSELTAKLNTMKDLALKWRSFLVDNGVCQNTNDGELAAFISYAMAYPSSTLCLIDTYDTLGSGCPNFLAVALALDELGFKALGIRLDSGDLAYLSRECRSMFKVVAQLTNKPAIAQSRIIASNDIHEEVLYSLNDQGHEIDGFGIGTNLVTCKAQPALGCVYKLVEIQGQPRIKISADAAKMTIPGKKDAYRLYSKDGLALLDVMSATNEPAPQPNRRILCRHPFNSRKRAHVIPSRVEPLLKCVFTKGTLTTKIPEIEASKKRCKNQVQEMREDHVRKTNPTPYKISVTEKVYNQIQQLFESEVPVQELT